MNPKKHEKKKKNRVKDKEYKNEAWKKGKLIEENHNNKPYSSPYTLELGTRLYNNAIKTFEYGKTYYILVKEVFVAEIYSFECFIYNEENEEVASATINVYQNEDDRNVEEILNG